VTASGGKQGKRLPVSDPGSQLGKRERQIMDVVFRRGRATVAEVLAELSDPPSYSSVRAMLSYLEGKGHLRHEQEGARYVYLATSPKEKVRSSALRHVVQTFFDGSVSSAVATLIQAQPLTDDEYERLSRLLDGSARKDGEP
jgi:BlaI family transcriptional regulator, penicillinase repressor